MPIAPGFCHCGRPLHYLDTASKGFVEEMVRLHGEYALVTAKDRCWLVPRHYIALHGLKARELPTLGFEEVPVADRS